MRKVGFVIMSSLFLLVGTLVAFWMLSIIGFLRIAERKKNVYRRGGD